MIHLADEVDAGAARNPKMLYDLESFTSEIGLGFYKRHLAVKDKSPVSFSYHPEEGYPA